ncbi:MAG: efflux RND transporter periplasmic adaptor subunit [Pseudomonadota bacterium]
MIKSFRPTLVMPTLACLVFLAGCAEEPETTLRRTTETRVVVEPVALSSAMTRVEAVGTSRALKSITLYPATSGEVVAVRFKPGQFVEKGQVLVELDQRDARLAVDLAAVRLTDAQRLFERYQSSAAVGATLPTTLDAARTELEAARIELDRARINLEDRTIEAPFAGYVGITDVDVGDRLQPSTAITTLDDRNSLLVSFAVPEVLIDKIRVGDQVDVATWNATGPQATGEVIEIDSRINPDTRTFVVRARVENPADSLRPGMSFRVALNMKGDPYPVLAEISLQWGADGSFIWSVVDGRATRVPVNIIQRQRGKVLVRGDLAPGDLVVVEGIQSLRSGTSVNAEMITAAHAKDPGVAGPG